MTTEHSSPESAAMDDMRDPEVASALRAEQAGQPPSPVTDHAAIMTLLRDAFDGETVSLKNIALRKAYDFIERSSRPAQCAPVERVCDLQALLEIRDFMADIVGGAELTERSRAAAAEFMSIMDVQFGSAWEGATVTSTESPAQTDMREALQECVDILALVEHPRCEDPQYGAEIARLGDRIGYGALMSSASASWRKRLGEDGDPVGREFVAGPCHATVTRALRMARDALSVTSTNSAAPTELTEDQTKLCQEIADELRATWSAVTRPERGDAA